MQPPAQIVVIDDDADMTTLVVDALTEHGFRASAANDGERGLALVSANRPDLVVLDLGLPDLGGLEVLRRLREDGRTPVIVLSGRTDVTDRVVALELGADDYVTKPFSPRELVARLQAVLRRSQPVEPDEVLSFGDLSIDTATHDVELAGRSIELTSREFDLLTHLARSPRRVFSSEQLLAEVWGTSPEWQNPATVSEHIYRLRRKLEPDPGHPRWIETLRGAGYRFTPVEAPSRPHDQPA